MPASLIGIKRHRVDLERATTVQTDTGALAKTWTRIGRVWADVTPIRGEELTQAQQLTATVSHRIRLRWSAAGATLTPADRIKWGGRLFELVSVIDVGERRRELEATAREVVA